MLFDEDQLASQASPNEASGIRKTIQRRTDWIDEGEPLKFLSNEASRVYAPIEF